MSSKQIYSFADKGRRGVTNQRGLGFLGNDGEMLRVVEWSGGDMRCIGRPGLGDNSLTHTVTFETGTGEGILQPTALPLPPTIEAPT